MKIKNTRARGYLVEKNVDQCYENVQKESTKQVRDKMYAARLPIRRIQAGKVVRAIDATNVRIYIPFIL